MACDQLIFMRRKKAFNLNYKTNQKKNKCHVSMLKTIQLYCTTSKRNFPLELINIDFCRVSSFLKTVPGCRVSRHEQQIHVIIDIKNTIPSCSSVSESIDNSFFLFDNYFFSEPDQCRSLYCYADQLQGLNCIHNGLVCVVSLLNPEIPCFY